MCRRPMPHARKPAGNPSAHAAYWTRLFTALALLLGSGCGGIPASSRPRLEDDETHAASRREEDLRKAQDVARALRLQVTAAAAEKEKLAAELVELRSEVRVERQRADQVAAEKAKLEDRVAAAEARADESKKTLERASILLALVAREIASVRLHWREFESRVRESGVREEDLDVFERNALLGRKIEELHFELLRERNLVAPYLKERKPETPAPALEMDEKMRERRFNTGDGDDPLLDAARSPHLAAGARHERAAARPPETARTEESREESRLKTLLRQKWEETTAGDLGLKVGFAILCTAALVLLLRRGSLRRAPGMLRGWIDSAAGAFSRLVHRGNTGDGPELVPKQDIEKVLGILEDEGRSREENGEDDPDSSPARSLFEGTPAERARARIAARAAAAANAEAAVLASSMDPGTEFESVQAEERKPESASKGTEILGDRADAGAPDSGLPDRAGDSGTQIMDIEISGTQVLEPPPPRTAPEAALTIPMNPPDTSGWRTPQDAMSTAGAGIGAQEPATRSIEEEAASTAEEATGTDIIVEASMDSWTLDSRAGEGSGPAAGTQMMNDEVRKDFQPTQVLSDSGGLDIGSTQVISRYEKLAPEPSPPSKETKAPRRQPPPPQKPRKASRKHKDEDEDLLAELEEIIGHKVDENPA